MSRTDIDQQYSLESPITVTQQYDNGFGYWFPPSTTKGMALWQFGTDYRKGTVTPSYVIKQQFGNLPENVFTRHRTEYKRFQGYEKYETYPNRYRWSAYGTFGEAYCTIPALRSLSSLQKLNLENQVKQKVLERIRDQDVNLAVAWAERDSTLRTIGDMLKRLGQAYSRAKHGDFPGAAKALGVSLKAGVGKQGSSISRGWLELQYGWLPLASDIHGSVKHLQKLMKPRREYHSVKVRREIEESFFFEENSSKYKDGTLCISKYSVLITVKMKSAASLLSEASALGLTNPLLVAWERVPFSFIIDWAIPIGSFLSQFDSTVGWQFENGSVTTVDERTSIKSRSPAPKLPSGYIMLDVGGNCSQKSFTLTRLGLTGFSNLLSLPYVKDPTSLLHALNALALLTSKR